MALEEQNWADSSHIYLIDLILVKVNNVSLINAQVSHGVLN